MRTLKLHLSCSPVLVLALWALPGGLAVSQTGTPAQEFHIYAGNTHSHTAYTWSHGEQFKKVDQANGKQKEPGISVSKAGVRDATKSHCGMAMNGTGRLGERSGRQDAALYGRQDARRYMAAKQNLTRTRQNGSMLSE